MTQGASNTSLKDILLKIVEKGGVFKENTNYSYYKGISSYIITNYQIKDDLKRQNYIFDICTAGHSLDDVTEMFLTVRDRRNSGSIISSAKSKKEILEILDIMKNNMFDNIVNKLTCEQKEYCFNILKYTPKRKIINGEALITIKRKIFE